MKIWRVSMRSIKEGHQGYEYFTAHSVAEHAVSVYRRADWADRKAEVEVHEFPVDNTLKKRDLIAVLNHWASHPNNG